MGSERRLIIDMIKSLEKFNSRLLTLSKNSEGDYNQIMNKILYNLETIQMLRNNELNGVTINGRIF